MYSPLWIALLGWLTSKSGQVNIDENTHMYLINHLEKLEVWFLHARNVVVRSQESSGLMKTHITSYLADSHFLSAFGQKSLKKCSVIYDSEGIPMMKIHHRLYHFDPKALGRYCIF